MDERVIRLTQYAAYATLLELHEAVEFDGWQFRFDTEEPVGTSEHDFIWMK